MTRLRDRFEAALLAAYPSAVIHGAAVERLPNTTCIAFPGLDRQALVMALDMAGVACSTGSALRQRFERAVTHTRRDRRFQ